ncbi:hypothetical protein Ae201684P_007639 [Aphanomyces euteiches]|nr:hypothetical protein Ae201684P_007639 [Aphanomyces euteiches]
MAPWTCDPFFAVTLPPSATSIDLSFNQINAISCPIPNSLNFLNVSHNALLNRWIQTPLTVQTFPAFAVVRQFPHVSPQRIRLE